MDFTSLLAYRFVRLEALSRIEKWGLIHDIMTGEMGYLTGPGHGRTTVSLLTYLYCTVTESEQRGAYYIVVY